MSWITRHSPTNPARGTLLSGSLHAVQHRWTGTARWLRSTPAALVLAASLALVAPPASAAEPAAAASTDPAARRAIAREELGIDVRVAYAGERIIDSTQAGRTVTFREYRAPGKARLEFEEGGQQIVMILDEPAAKAFMLLPALNLYSEVGVQDFQARAWESLDLLDFEKLDRETVGGHPATRYRVSWRDPDGHEGHGFHWVTDDGVPIRMEITYDSPDKAGERVVAELSNLTVGPQDPSLFERPAGYMALPSLEGLLGTDPGAAAGSGGITLDGLEGLLGL